MIKAEITCQNFGDRAGCLGTPDPQYTMDFTDVGEGKIYWCSHCGPEAHAMNAALEHAFATRGPDFQRKFEEAVSKAEARGKSKIS